MSVIKSFFLEADNFQRSYANLREMDMKNENWGIFWETGKKIDVDIELPANTFKEYIGDEANASGKEVKEIFDKKSRIIYNLDIIGKQFKRAEQVEQLIYIPGKYYEVVYSNSFEKDYNHSVYVFCSYADFKGSKVHVYEAKEVETFKDDELTLYKYKEPEPPLTPTATTGVIPLNVKDAEMIEPTSLDQQGETEEPLTYTVDIYKINDKGSPEEYKKDGEIVYDVTKIPLSQPGALFLLKYNLEKFEVPNITKTIKILTNDESKNKDTLLTKYSEIRYPYQYTAEKHSSLVKAFDALIKKCSDATIKNFNVYYKADEATKIIKVNKEKAGPGSAYDVKLNIVSLDKNTFNDIEFLKNKIDYIYNTVKLKTNYKYDSIKWLRFITKYLNYNAIITKEQVSIIIKREKLLNAFKKYGVTDKQKQELYCFDLYDKDFHKLIHLDDDKPTKNGRLLLDVKEIFKDEYTDSDGKKIGNTEQEARNYWKTLSFNPVEKEEFDMLWERRHNFKSINREYEREADSNKGKFTVIKSAGNWKGKSDVDGKEYDLVDIYINSEGEAVSSDKTQYIFKNNAGSNEQATGVLGFERSSGYLYTDWGARKGYRMAEHLQNLLIGITSGINLGISSSEKRINDEKFKAILGKKDDDGSGDNMGINSNFAIGGKKHSRTHKKRKTLKKRSSRRRH